METIYIVTIRGEHVWNDCALKFAVKEINDTTLENIRVKVAKQCNLEVGEFISHANVWWNAMTSDEDVDVYIEPIEITAF